ncbi:hypothetical protein T440DRAFT_483916 [Plenodomus tracheiphilus IPT5]|uniref:Uncharacterized protein n=1 Tax=Plenodomus tracheiphilus IPT5 TaxID=1408161 RepID=A0A6A7AND7_9PLEO|nr:hypothetical protein T440DRAFT_483916 [Plenodomus tracheiphilus IPT5]
MTCINQDYRTKGELQPLLQFASNGVLLDNAAAAVGHSHPHFEVRRTLTMSCDQRHEIPSSIAHHQAPSADTQQAASANKAKRKLVVVLRLPRALLEAIEDMPNEQVQAPRRRAGPDGYSSANTYAHPMLESTAPINPLDLLAEAAEILERLKVQQEAAKDVENASRALMTIKNESTPLDILAEAATFHQHGIDASTVNADEILFEMSMKK